jgi:hypothetical protein
MNIIIIYTLAFFCFSFINKALGQTPSPTPAPILIIFLSASTYQGNVRSIIDPDTVCNNDAIAFGLNQGSSVAILDLCTGACSTFTQTPKQIYSISGTLIAANANDIFYFGSSTLSSLSDAGVCSSDKKFWVGFEYNPLPTIWPGHVGPCSTFTSLIPAGGAIVGVCGDSAGSEFWWSATTTTCADSYYLLCMYDGQPAQPSAMPSKSPSKSPSSSPKTTLPTKSPSLSPSNKPSTTTPSKSPSTTKPSTSPKTSTPSTGPTKSPTFTSRLILYSDNEWTDGNVGTYADAYTRCNEEQLFLNLECTKVEPFLYFGDEYEDKLPGNFTGLPVYDVYGTPIASDWDALVGTSAWTNSLSGILDIKSWSYGSVNCNNWQSSSDCLNGLIQNPTATKFSNKRAGCNTPKTILCLCQGNKELPDKPTRQPTTWTPSKSPSTTKPSTSPITNIPSKAPSKAPSRGPSSSPITSTPSNSPSKSPTTNKPSKSPSKSPSFPTTAPTSAGVRLLSPSGGLDLRFFGKSVAISQDNKTIIAGNPGGFAGSGGAFIFFKNSSGIWSQQGPELAAPGVYSAGGFSVSISGNTVAYGCPGGAVDTNGEVRIHTRSGTTWTLQQVLEPRSLPLVYDYVGYSVSLSSTDGNTLAIGASEGSNPSLGGVYVFTRSGSVWTQQAALQATGLLGASSNCGSSVSLSSNGDTLATGCRYDNSGVGAVYIFTRSIGVWSQQAKLIGTPSSVASIQGASVSLTSDGNMVAFNADESVFVFTRSGISWTQQTRIAPTDHAGTPYFGSSVSLSSDGSRLVIGGYNDDTGIGASWIYSRSGAVWSQYLTKKRELDLTEQGYSVSLSQDGTTFVAGTGQAVAIVVYDI